MTTHGVVPLRIGIACTVLFLGMALAGMPSMAGARAAETASPPIAGIWRTQNGAARISIARCTAPTDAQPKAAYPSGPHCGTIIWLKRLENTEAAVLDTQNPDPVLRNRPVVGLTVLTGLTDTDGIWRGSLYAHNRGVTADATVRVAAQDTLTVEACVGSFLCRTQVWTRDKR